MRILGLGGFEWIMIVLVLVLLLGAGKLANIGPALGKSIRGFRDELRGGDKPADPKEAPVSTTTNTDVDK